MPIFKKSTLLCCVTVLLSPALFAQVPEKWSSAELYHRVQKLNVLASVLYIAAHPDDENTRVISYTANHLKARTAYLSLTRGDGGQNLIGPELRETLGLIRTQELLQARKFDRGIQYFTRANDFGFSKLPDETLRIWDQKAVLEDMNKVIQEFKPDIIINRFDHRTPGTTHGHHTSSALLSLELFDENLKNKNLWNPKRVFFNTSWWFYGSRDAFQKADKSNLIPLSTGVFYPHLGLSNQEIAALSRSQHQSQGFGTMGDRGEEIEYLEILRGTFPKNSHLFEGIDISWNRVKAPHIGKKIDGLLKNFPFDMPEKMVPELLQIRAEIAKINDSHWQEIKLDELDEILFQSLGMFAEAQAAAVSATRNSSVQLQLEWVNRSRIPVRVIQIKNSLTQMTERLDQTLLYNQKIVYESPFTIPEKAQITQPYWLMLPANKGMYQSPNMEWIGWAETPNDRVIQVDFDVMGTVITRNLPIIYKFLDPVKGEQYRPFVVVPEVSIFSKEQVQIFTPGQSKKVKITVQSLGQHAMGRVRLEDASNQGWEISPAYYDVEVAKGKRTKTYEFTITPPKNASQVNLIPYVAIGGSLYANELVQVAYDHIVHQQFLRSSAIKCMVLDRPVSAKKIAYIMGAGDEIPMYLTQLGYDVQLVTPAQFDRDYLRTFDVYLFGIRAFNTIDALADQQQLFFDLVAEGKTMIVQYNTTGGLVTQQVAPYPLSISRDRVTDEHATVRLLQPNHPVLQKPFKISSTDFEGWEQELGLYFPNKWDDAFTPILSANDEGEQPKNGLLLTAKHGKGWYIYTGLSFFRELPAAVPGAYKLFANMIELSNSDK